MTSALPSFDPRVLTKLQQVLSSTAVEFAYGATGAAPYAERQIPFLEEFTLRRLAFEPGSGRQRIRIHLTDGSRDIVAIADANDYIDVSRMSRRNRLYPNLSVEDEVANLIATHLLEALRTFGPGEGERAVAEVRVR
jgi:hypothetical protein